MNYKPGTNAPVKGIYWCTVCKTPAAYDEGQELPGCPNLCGRGYWHLVSPAGAKTEQAKD